MMLESSNSLLNRNGRALEFFVNICLTKSGHCDTGHEQKNRSLPLQKCSQISAKVIHLAIRVHFRCVSVYKHIYISMYMYSLYVSGGGFRLFLYYQTIKPFRDLNIQSC